MKYLIFLAAVFGTPVFADAPQVVAVEATQTGKSWQFRVTIAHADTGWDDFADGWEIIDAQGNLLGRRPLAHPHVNEQPFTRGLSDVVIPEGTQTVFVRVRDNLHGWYDERRPVALTAP